MKITNRIALAAAVLTFLPLVSLATPKIDPLINPFRATTTASAPAPPAHSVSLSWTPSTDGVANPSLGYLVFRGATAGGEATTPLNSSLVAVGCSSVSTCIYSDTSVIPGVFFYFVEASLNGANSVPSNEVTVTITVAPASGLTVTGHN